MISVKKIIALVLALVLLCAAAAADTWQAAEENLPRFRTLAELLKEAEEQYDLIVMDAPPINIVSDALTLSAMVAGCLFVIRQNYSDDREIRKALIAAELTNMNVLGFIFYADHLHRAGNYNRLYYNKYYHKYYGENDRRGDSKKGRQRKA